MKQIEEILNVFLIMVLQEIIIKKFLIFLKETKIMQDQYF